MRILCTGDIKRVFRIQVQSANTLHGEHNKEYSASDKRRYIRSESMNWVAPIKDEQVLQKFKDTLKEIDEKYLILFEIGIGTGLQLQDILQFKVGDVRGKESLTVNIGARSIEQTFHLSSELQKIIADFIKDRDDDEYLITGYAKNLQPLSREQTYRVFRKAGLSIGLKSIGTQTMRKTFAWRYYKETGDIYYIQNLLNHASPNITFRYIGEKPNLQVMYGKITEDDNQKAMQYLLTDKHGIAEIDDIIASLKMIRKKLTGKLQEPDFYGKTDMLLEILRDTIRDYEQS